MPWGEIGLHSLALLAFPGALTLLLLGVPAEWGAAWALVPERGGLLPAGRSLLQGVQPSARPLGLPPMATAAALMALLAATQVAVPLSPIPAGERNLMVAAVALGTAGWAAWAWGWNRRELNPRLVLSVQGVWVVAVFAPAFAQRKKREMGAKPSRSFYPCEARTAKARALARSRPAHADSAAEFRFDRAAAQSRGSRTVQRGPQSPGVREARGHAARFAALRRALGATLA